MFIRIFHFEVNDMPIEGYVVSHTHWDREWYLTFQEYRMRLLRVIDKAIRVLTNNPEYRAFMLDGQVSVIEDYLDINREKEEIIRYLVSSKKLIIGPWYTQMDEALVSGESIIRNLLIGHRIGLKYGGVMKVGYLPDTFGHTPQLPQILQGFNIDSFIFMRGTGDEEKWLDTEFYWEAPDGSRVFTIHLERGYCNANMLGIKNSYASTIYRAPEGWFTVFLKIYESEPHPDLEMAYSRIKSLYEDLYDKTPSKTLLLMNGCDHMPPQEYVTEVINHINSCHSEFVLRHTTLEDYVNLVKNRVKNLKLFKGELRGARSHPLLVGVLSTRIYLKQLNYRSQLLLEKYAEPLSSIAFVKEKVKYPKELLWKAWKLVLENQAHDSIYGSGTDPLHQENETRFLKAIEIASNIAFEKLESLTKTSDEECDYLIIFNPSSWERTEFVKFLYKKDNVELIDLSSGEKISVRKIDDLKYWANFSELGFIAKNIPSVGYKVYKIVESNEPVFLSLSDNNIIENEFYRIEAEPRKGGELRIIDKTTGRVYEGFNVYVDEGDAGDEYNYSPPKEKDVKILSSSFTADVKTLIGEVVSILDINLVMKIPSHIEDQKRSENTVELPIKTKVYLYKGSRRIDIETIIDNKAKDHRLRVRFPTSFKTDKSIADYHFYVIERSIKPVSKGEDWVEKPPTTHPQHYWVGVSDGTYSLIVANKGLPEYEVKDENGATIYLTLFRSVGWLSRDDLVTRRGNAGPQIPTPDAQCLRKMKFEYSLIFHTYDWLKSKAYKDARNFAEPLFIAVEERRPEENKKSFIKIIPDELILTAFKKAEDRDWLLIRFYNISSNEIKGKIITGFKYREVWRANLDEEPIYKILSGKNSNEVTLTVRGHEIVTLLFNR